MEKKLWQKIIDSDFAIPTDHTLTDLTDTLLSYLGSTDYELRDEIGFMILANWIDGGQYSPNELQKMLPSLLANLKQGLGENGTDSVYLRSFSVLILSTIVYEDNQTEFLTETEVRQLLDEGLHYFKHEKDLRGFDDEKGWAHSAAHTADLLCFLARNRHLQAHDLERILKAIVTKLAIQSGYVYINSEDERMTRIVISALKRNLLEPGFLNGWVNDMISEIKKFEGIPFNSKLNSVHQNTKNFIRSVYLCLELSEDPLPHKVTLKSKLLDALRTFN